MPGLAERTASVGSVRRIDDAVLRALCGESARYFTSMNSSLEALHTGHLSGAASLAV